MTQMGNEHTHSFEQICEQTWMGEVTLIGSAQPSEAESSEEAELIASSPEECSGAQRPPPPRRGRRGGGRQEDVQKEK